MAEELELKVPSVGESITEVQVGKWHKSIGQRVEKDENVVELESDKATVDLPAPATGAISKILKQSGQTAAVGEVIGYVLTAHRPRLRQPRRHRPLKRQARRPISGSRFGGSSAGCWDDRQRGKTEGANRDWVGAGARIVAGCASSRSAGQR